MKISELRDVLFESARRTATRCVLHNKVDNCVDIQMLCRTSNSNVVEMLWKRTCNLLHNNILKVKGTFLSTTEQNNSTESRRISVRLKL